MLRWWSIFFWRYTRSILYLTTQWLSVESYTLLKLGILTCFLAWTSRWSFEPFQLLQFLSHLLCPFTSKSHTWTCQSRHRRGILRHRAQCLSKLIFQKISSIINHSFSQNSTFSGHTLFDHIIKLMINNCFNSIWFIGFPWNLISSIPDEYSLKNSLIFF